MTISAQIRPLFLRKNLKSNNSSWFHRKTSR